MAAASLQERFGLAIRERRSRVGLSQEQLADLAGLHRTYVSLLERGHRNPSLNVIASLAGALRTSMSALIEPLDTGVRKGDRLR